MIPQHRELDPVYIGQPWSTVITAYSDHARTTPFDFTGWTATLPTSVPVLPVTVALDVDASTITLSLTGEQTAVLRPGCANYALALTAPNPLDGGLALEGPIPILRVPAGWSLP